MVNNKANNRVNTMAKAKHKPPSRIRYEQTHPVISIRVNKELYQKLKEVKEMGNKSFADILKEALGIQKRSTRGAYKRGYKAGYADGLKNPKFSLGNCSKCGKALYWDLSRENDVKLLTKAIHQAHYIHLITPPPSASQEMELWMLQEIYPAEWRP